MLSSAQKANQVVLILYQIALKSGLCFFVWRANKTAL